MGASTGGITMIPPTRAWTFEESPAAILLAFAGLAKFGLVIAREHSQIFTLHWMSRSGAPPCFSCCVMFLARGLFALLFDGFQLVPNLYNCVEGRNKLSSQ